MSWSIEERRRKTLLPEPFKDITSGKVKRYKDIIIISYFSMELENVIKFLDRHYDALKKLGIKYIVHHYATAPDPIPLVDNTIYIYCSPYSDHVKPHINIVLPREWYRVSGDMDFVRKLSNDCIVIGDKGKPFLAYDPRHNVYVLADITHYYIPNISESLWDFIVALMKKMKGMKKDPHEIVDKLMREDILWLRYSLFRDLLASLIHTKIEAQESVVLLPLEYNDGDITIKVTSDNVNIIGKTRAHRKGLRTKYFGDYLEKLENLEYDVEVEVVLTYKPVIVNDVVKLQLDSVKGIGYVIIDGVRLWHPNIHRRTHEICTGDVSVPREVVIEKNLLTELKYKSKIMELLASLTNPNLDNNASAYGYELWKYINNHIICPEEDRYDEDDWE